MSDRASGTAGSERDRLEVVRDALHKVQAQAAALEQLSEELSLSVHMLEGEVERLLKQAAASASPPQRAMSDLPGAPQDPLFEPPARSTDVEGARLVALNMVLGGDSREATGRYLDEHFDVPDRERLLDDVYAAAGG